MIPFTTDLLKTAILMILQVQHDDGSHIVPWTTLSAAASVGDLSLTPTSAVDFLPETIIALQDFTTEPSMMIAEDYVAGDIPISLSFTGRKTPGLTVAHPAGTILASNIFRTPLTDEATSFDNGYPVIGLYVLDNTSTHSASREWDNTARISLVYQLAGIQADNNRLDAQLWLEQQLDRGETDADLIIDSFVQNPAMVVDGTQHAINITRFYESRRRNMADPKKPVFEFYLDVDVLGLPRRMN